MTSTDYSEWAEFKREIRDDIKDVRKVVIGIGNNIATITAELDHRPDEAQMLTTINDAVDKRVAEQVKSCRGENTGIVHRDRITTPPPAAKKTDWIKVAKTCAYIAAASSGIAAGVIAAL